MTRSSGARDDPTRGVALQGVSRREKLIVSTAFVVLAAVYTWWIHYRFPIHLGDSAIFAQLADRLAETGRPLSQTAAAISYVFSEDTGSILTAPAEQLCSMPLPGPGPAEFNFMQWHTYLSLYLYLPVFKLLGGELGMSLLIAVDFLVVLFGGYVILRKRGLPVLFAAVAGALLMLHPAWTGGVTGAFYADRLFVGPAFILCALLLAGRIDSPWVYALAILLTLTTERAGFNYGGAEKTAYIVHYHSFYFPVLAATVVFSLARLYRKYPRWISWSLAGWLLAANFAYNFETRQYDFQFADLATRSFAYPFRNHAAERRVIEPRRELTAYTAQYPDASISTHEPLLPSLYLNHTLGYYPFGIDDSDFVVIPRVPPDRFGGVFSYLGGEESTRINDCLAPRLLARYRIDKEIGPIVVLARRIAG